MLWEPPTPAPRRLDLARANAVGRFGPFPAGLPAGWLPYAGSAQWEARDGSIYGRAENDKPAILRWEPELEGNDAIRFRGAAIRREGETDLDVATNGNLNCFFDCTGDYGQTAPATYSMVCAGLAGWYAGMSGLELLDSTLGVPVRAVSASFVLAADRTYDVLAGRFDNLLFVFVDGRLIAAVDLLSELRGTDVDGLRRRRSRVAIGTWGRPGGSVIRIGQIEVYQLPDDAVGDARVMR